MTVFQDRHHVSNLFSSLRWQSLQTAITSVVFDDSLSRQRSLRQSLMVVLFSKEPFAVAFGNKVQLSSTKRFWSYFFAIRISTGRGLCSTEKNMLVRRKRTEYNFVIQVCVVQTRTRTCLVICSSEQELCSGKQFFAVQEGFGVVQINIATTHIASQIHKISSHCIASLHNKWHYIK